MKIVSDYAEEVNIDDIAIGRDLALAQFIAKLPSYVTDRYIFDRQYWSSYVYGQAWRDKYSKAFWEKHIQVVESYLLYTNSKIKIVFLQLTENDFKRVESNNRKKDKWDLTTDFRYQYDLYQEVIRLSKMEIHMMKAFQDDKYIIDFIRNVVNA